MRTLLAAGAIGPAPAGAPAGPGAHPVAPPPLVLLGGVPGAGKSTVLRAATSLRPDVEVLDSERQQRRLAPYLSAWPYRLWRPLVHGLHYAGLLRVLLSGARADRPLLVHDTATRAWVRVVVGRLAAARGWRPVLLLLDVGHDEALAGQAERARVVRPASFARHWRRWSRLRAGLVSRPASPAEGSWDDVRLVSRQDAVAQVLSALDGSQD